MTSFLEKSVTQSWYSRSGWTRLLAPLAYLYKLGVNFQRQQYLHGKKIAWRAPIPVVVVGNITVGGTGKTPIMLSLIELLQAAGFRPGVISRGYGGISSEYPLNVTEKSDPRIGGDEPVMIARRTGCPVVVDPNRVRAAQALLRWHDIDIILSDDGLQHWALARDIELVIIDGQRGLGNGLLLPAGPLRESPARLDNVDFVLVNGALAEPLPVASDSMQLVPTALINLKSGDMLLSPFTGFSKQLHAVAAIGNPARFFNVLAQFGFSIYSHAFSDHHRFLPNELSFSNDLPIVMTEKDAVKCVEFATSNMWYLRIDARLPNVFGQNFLERVKQIAKRSS